MLCPICKKNPAHPQYNNRCEDCWVGGFEIKVIRVDEKDLTRHFKGRTDRHWNKPSPKKDS